MEGSGAELGQEHIGDSLAGNATVALGRWTVHQEARPLACLPRGWRPTSQSPALCGPGKTFAAPGSEPREEGDGAPDVQLIPKIFPDGPEATGVGGEAWRSGGLRASGSAP